MGLMEDDIGVALFERTARGMIPTSAGDALALRPKRALAETRHAVADIAALRGITEGTVTVGALPLGCTRLLPESIAGVLGRHPGLRVATIEGSFENLAADLRAGDLDFILGPLRPVEFASDLQGEALADDELAIVSLSDTRPVIGITQRRDSLASPGAKALIEQLVRRSRDVLASTDR
jgi:LysR family transcriptional regulator of gallate degradation